MGMLGTNLEQGRGMTKRASNREPNDTGFSMIEIMIVLALIGLITGMVAVGIQKSNRDAKIRITKNQIHGLAQFIFQHRQLNSGACPDIQQWLVDKTLRSEPKDPWGHPLRIVCPGTHEEEDSADIVSLGPDGKLDTGDDIRSWELP